VDRRALIAGLPLLVLLTAPTVANAATQVGVQEVQGLDVVVAVDDDSAAQIETARGIDQGDAFVAVQSAGGATALTGCQQIDANTAACVHPTDDFDALVVYGEGGNDMITLGLIADNLSPLHGEAYGGTGDDTLRAPPDFRDVPQPETYIEGEGGNDTIVSGEGPSELHGGDGNDTMQAFGGPDDVYGEGGDDSVSAGKEEPEANAADLVDGGAGFDTIPDVDADYNRGFDDDVSVTVDGQANDGEAGEGDNVIGVEKLRVVANNATVVGSDGPDDVFVEANTSTIKGLGGNDRLVAYDGNDAIEGGDGDDYLEGGFGNDALDGGGGVDQFQGDRLETDVIAIGNDQVRARDGNAEQVSCGIGADTAQVDAGDVVDATCESVDRGTLAFGSNTRVTLQLAAGRIPAAGPLKVRVQNANGFTVTGEASGQTTKKIDVSRKRRVKLKAKGFSVGANAKKTVKLTLPAALRRLLKRTGKLSLRLTVRVKDPAGNTRTVTKKVTPKLKRRRR
jgi:RTX calcium-binding nonapeptide repeat (4 copies)